MEPYLCNLEQHSKYLAFRFTLDGDGKAELHYKRLSNMEWEPSGNGVHVLVVGTFFTHTHTHTHMHSHHMQAKRNLFIL